MVPLTKGLVPTALSAAMSTAAALHILLILLRANLLILLRALQTAERQQPDLAVQCFNLLATSRAAASGQAYVPWMSIDPSWST